MAQVADNPQYTFPPSPQSAPPSSFDDMLGDDKTKQLTSDLTRIYEQKSKAESGLQAGEQKAIQADRQKMDKAYQQEGHVLDDLKPWNADQEMAKRSHSPMEEFGSFATIFSIAASAFTHTPATNAMNAAAAYMNAVNSNDAAGYNKAFQAFKENTELAIKRANIEHEQFEDANKLLSTDMTLWRAKTEAAAARFGNLKTLALLRSGMDPDVLNAQASFWKAKEGMADALDHITDSKLKMDYVNARMKSLPPEQQNDPKKHMQFVRDFEADAEAKNPEQQAYRGFVKNYEDTHDGQQPPTEEIVKFLKGLGEARYGGRGTLTGGLMSEAQKRMDAYDAANPEAPDDQKNAAHDKIMRDVIGASKPIAGTPTKAKEIEAQKQDIMNRNPDMSEADAYTLAAKNVQTANQAPKNFSNPEQKSLTVAPELMKHLETLDAFASATGTISGLVQRLGAEYGGVNDPAIIWQTAKRQAEAAVAELASGGRVSVAGLKAQLEQLPDDYKAARFGKYQVQQFMQDLRDKMQSELSTMEQEGKPIPPDVLSKFEAIGVYPKSIADKDPLLVLRDDPSKVPTDSLVMMSQYMSALPLADQQKIVAEAKRRLAQGGQ